MEILFLKLEEISSFTCSWQKGSDWYCRAQQCWLKGQNFGECSTFNQTFIGFEETSRYWSVQFVLFISAFHWSPSISKLHMTLVSFVKTMELYEVSLVTINWQTLYDCGILCEH